MAADNSKKRFLGAGPVKEKGLVRQSIPPEAYPPMKPEADKRRGPGMPNIRHSRSF